MSPAHHLGKYRLLAELGHGGMADVYLAMVEGPMGLGFAKIAVVKRLRANLADDPEFVTMLIDEARITARLNHPNVVQMLEVDVAGEEYFLAMEYLDGQPLHRIDRRLSRLGESLPLETQLTVILDVLSGLHHAHELTDYDGSPLNIIHRDVTPQNIFVTYEGQVKVMDFGIAKAAGRAQETKHGIVKGKTRFMSPEQALGCSLDRRSDIFAVGILLWQAATNQRFWGELDDLAIVQGLVGGRYETSPRAVCPDVPAELDRICQRALGRNADDRYATALEMHRDLEAFLGSSALGARRDLVALLGEHFANERSQIRGIIEKAGREAHRSAMNASTSSTSTTPVARSIAPDVSEFEILTLVPPPLTSHAPDASSATFAPRAIKREAPERPSRTPIFLSAIAASAITVLGFTALSAPNDDTLASDRSTSMVMSDFVRLSDARRASAARSLTPTTFAIAPRASAAPLRTATASQTVVASAPTPEPSAPVRKGIRSLKIDTGDPYAAEAEGRPSTPR